MIELFKLLINNLDYLDKALVLSKNLENLKKEEFAELHKLLPFAFNRFKKELVLSGSCFSNYFQRGLPKKNKTTILKIKPLLIKELEERRQETAGFIKTLKNIVFFNWDEIESIKEMNYNDYVYDLVVPEGHCFVGGNMPTLMHNTQLGHILAVTVQLPKEKGGANGMSVFLDGEATFRPERIQQLAKALKLDPEKTLKNIKVARCFNSDHQMLLAEKIEDLIKKDKLPIKLVVVDSLTAHFRAEFIGRGTLSERQQKLNKHMHTLMRLASTYNVAVYVTNQVMAKPDMFFGDPTEAIGGHIVSHNSAFRIYLRKGKKGTRVAKLVDAPNLPDGEAIFMVTEEGLKDT
jgi:DNA repair protein RadA